MKKFFLLAISLFFLTGCNSYTELNQLGIVSLVGIDYQEENYHVYIYLVEPQEETTALTSYNAEGSSIEEAMHQLYLKSNKKMYLAHMDALVLSKEAIDEKLKEIVTYLLNQREIRNNFELMEVDSLNKLFEEKKGAQELIELVHTNENYMGTTQSITFEKFLENLLIDTNTTIPLLSFNKELKVEGLSLIHNFQTIDTLSTEETILLNLLENNLKESIYQEITIYESKTNLEFQKENNLFHIYLEVNQNPSSFSKELEKELRRLLIYYEEQDYDLIKLKQRRKENRLESNATQIKRNFTFDIHIAVRENNLERKK